MDILRKARRLEHAIAQKLDGVTQRLTQSEQREPLAVLLAIVDEVEQETQQAGRGKRVFPFNRITASVVAGTPGERARFEAVFDDEPSLERRRQTPDWIYAHVYCARGDGENRLKELKLALAFGRTNCTRFWANQLRITLTATAFVLFQELQLRADRTALRGAQVPRLRQALITIGVHVVRSVRRIVLHFPRSHPEAVTWARLARALGAAPA
jgi:hypothetical protein